MNYRYYCLKCEKEMKKIPIRKHDKTIIVEYFCEHCDESITFYPATDEFKKEKPQFF
jgi:predicted SprT family Zn-dependent metalloprotease